MFRCEFPLGAMKCKRYLAKQVVAVLKETGPGMTVPALVRELGYLSRPFTVGKKRFMGLESKQVCEPAQLQDKSWRLKNLIAELSEDKAIMRDIRRIGTSETVEIETLRI